MSNLIISPQGEDLAKQITPEEVLFSMKCKAMAFEVMFYLMCYNPKTKQMAIPKNTSKYSDEDYAAIMTTLTNLLNFHERKDIKRFVKHTEAYADGLATRFIRLMNEKKNATKIELAEARDLLR